MLLSVLAIVLVGGAAAVFAPYVRGLAAVRRKTIPTPAEARVLRLTPVVEVPPAPLPTALPLIAPEPSGTGKHVDRRAFRTLLLPQQYAALNGYFDELQTAFEGDASLEHWPSDAANAFAATDAVLRARLDAWVLATPGHFAPYLARGEHLTAFGNPGDARAYFERAGTYGHLGRPADSLADVTRACDLGSTESCAMKRRFGGPR